jgi:hypothetical protein
MWWEIDVEMLEEQVATLGRVMDRECVTSAEKEHLEGVWNMLHHVIDDIQTINNEG